MLDSETLEETLDPVASQPAAIDYRTIDANYEKLGAKQILLTHMGEGMLAEIAKVDMSRYMIAEDGMTIDL